MSSQESRRELPSLHSVCVCLCGSQRFHVKSAVFELKRAPFFNATICDTFRSSATTRRVTTLVIFHLIRQAFRGQFRWMLQLLHGRCHQVHKVVIALVDREDWLMSLTVLSSTIVPQKLLLSNQTAAESFQNSQQQTINHCVKQSSLRTHMH